MSKDCGNHGKKRQKLRRRIFAGILIFLFIVLVIFLIIWAVLQPSKPKFFIQDITVNTFSVTAGNFISTNLVVTVSSKNPNDKIGIYYDRLNVYAVYQNQQITLRSAIPPSFQDTNEINIWSPPVYGNLVPISPYNGVSLSQDQAVGTVPLSIKLDGRVRFKVGSFISARYNLNVDCPAVISSGNPTAGVIVGNNAVKYQLSRECSVSV